MAHLPTQEDLRAAASTNLFAGMNVADVSALLSNGAVLEEPKGSLLFSHGENADRFYILLSGQVKLFTANEAGEESIVEIFNGVNSFAEAAMFGSARFPVSCELLQDGRILQIDAKGFLAALQADPELSGRFLKNMAQRQRGLTQEIIQLKKQTPALRLASFFLTLLEDTGETQADGSLVAALPYDKHLIAARIGMQPESLSRALTKLREFTLECGKKEVRIQDLSRLHDYLMRNS